jgi:hypothetical protein
MRYEWRRHDREAVLEALRQGEYEAIAPSGQGTLDALVHLAIEIGVFEALSVLAVTRERDGIPAALLWPPVGLVGICLWHPCAGMLARRSLVG